MKPVHALASLTLALGLVTLGAGPAVAAPPANDDFDDAIVLTGLPFEAAADTTEATRAPDDPTCFGDDFVEGNTVWYDFTPEADVDLVVDTFGSDYDTVLAALTGARGSLELVACNDDTSTLQSRVRFPATAGVTYHLMIGSFPTTPGGSLVLHGQEAPPPLELSVTLDPAGAVDDAGVATLHGSVSCSREADIDLTGTLRQRGPGKRVTVGSFATPVHCSGTVPWTATVVGETGRYRRGAADAVAATTFFDDLTGTVVTARASGTVQLS